MAKGGVHVVNRLQPLSGVALGTLTDHGKVMRGTGIRRNVQLYVGIHRLIIESMITPLNPLKSGT